MISRVRGLVLEKQAQHVLIEANGVGYELLVPINTVFQLPEVGKEAILYTHFVVREDAQLLYGFYDTKERELFRILIRVNGVGPKMALTILSGMESQEFAACVQNNDINTLVKLPGVGKKTAERLLVEIRDKLSEWQPESDPKVIKGSSSPNHVAREAETALQSLGYKAPEASKAVAAALKQLKSTSENIASEDLIRVALRSMA